jgi:squalene cyclase
VNEFPECSKRIYSYLKRTQIACDEVDKELFFRHQSKGGWPFSTAAHGWPISDCTAEGLKAVLALNKQQNLLLTATTTSLSIVDLVSVDMLNNACDVILSLQNNDGGWATYENNRGYGWLVVIDFFVCNAYCYCTFYK